VLALGCHGRMLGHNTKRVLTSFRIVFLIQMDIGGHLPFPTGSKQFSDIFGNLLFLAVFTSGAILRA
jgi:hypothetical protein